MNSSAALKAFVGRHGGAVCTSSNARAVLDLGARPSGDKVLFFPDQHLGRNTGFDHGLRRRRHAGLEPAPATRRARGARRQGGHAAAVEGPLLGAPALPARRTSRPLRAEHPDGEVIVHPECAHDVVELADRVGSTERILEWVEPAPAGAALGDRHRDPHGPAPGPRAPGQDVVSLDPLICPCSTMFRIDAPHLAWVLEYLVAGRSSTRSSSTPTPRTGPRAALQRMLDIT